MRTGLAAILLLVVVSLLSVPLLLSTQQGSRWLLGFVPGLQMQGYQGVLLGRWSATALSWESADVSVSVLQPAMEIQPGCLLRARLCIQALQAADVAIKALSGDKESDSPAFELPDVRLPLDVSIERLQLGRLLLNDELVLSDLDVQMAWQGNRLEVAHLSLKHQEYGMQLSGWLSPHHGWPLDVQVQGQGGLTGLGEQHLDAQLSGTLMQLKLSALLSGVLEGNLQAEVQPLTDGVPGRLELRLDELHLAQVLPELLQVQQLSIAATGDMLKGYQWEQQADMAVNGLALQLLGNGRLHMQGVDVSGLELLYQQQVAAHLAGRLDWHQDLQARAALHMYQADWNTLLGMQELDIALESLQADMSYANGRYQAQLESILQGPPGKVQLEVALQGDEKQLQLRELQLMAGPGRVNGRADLDFGTGLGWQASVQVSDLDPAYWLAGLQGRLAGSVESGGLWQGEQLDAVAHVNLQGTLRNEPASMQLDINGSGTAWQVSELLVRLGENSLTGALQINENLAGQVRLEAGRLAQLLPGLAGQARGQLVLEGSWQQPVALLDASATGLAYQGWRVRQLELNAELDAYSKASVRLQAQGLASEGQALGSLTLLAEGGLQEQALSLNLRGPLSVQGKVHGNFDAEALRWRGEIGQLDLALARQQWQLDDPLQLDYRHAQSMLQTGAHCLRSGQASLCAEGLQQWLPRLRLDYRLHDFPLASLQPWLPRDVQLNALLNGRINVEQQAQGLQGHALLDAGQGVMRYSDEHEQQHDFAWQVLRLDADLGLQQITSRLELRGAQTGHLLLDLGMEPQKADKPLQGGFRLEQLDLQPLRALIPHVDELQGVVQGQGRIRGSLLQPVVNGNISLTNARVAGGSMPLDMEELNVQVQILDTRAQLSGGWRSGEQGRATLEGDFQWQAGMVLDVALKGSELPLRVAPYADLTVAPDLHISLDERRLAVDGRIAVPRGSITVPQLPVQAVRVSPDARVLGRSERQQGLPVSLDIEIVAGQEQLKFSGFGLTAEVQGQMRLGDNLVGRGLLELKNGRYRAYGQRLQLRRARLVFSGPISQPYIDIEAVRVTGDVTAGVRLVGLADQPQSEIFSQPAMSQEQALSWLLLGRPLSGGNDTEAGALGQAALALGMMGTAPLVERVAGMLGIRDFQLDTEGSGLTTSVMASGRLTDRLVLSYGVGVFQSSSIVLLRYELTKRLYLEAASSLANSLDIFYRRNF